MKYEYELPITRKNTPKLPPRSALPPSGIVPYRMLRDREGYNQEENRTAAQEAIVRLFTE